ncbi:MAG: dTMP kinase [Luteitalea sp.]|nr:dTMP kinase [Luteitalea sp.]
MFGERRPSCRHCGGDVLIAVEGVDQSGKQTQVEALAQHLRERHQRVETLEFPVYTTPIGQEIRAALASERSFPPDVLQLLFVANRGELRPQIEAWLADGAHVICDRYVASSVAYGEAQGLDPRWLRDIQRFLPRPGLTVLLDITPSVAALRKQRGRDRFEADLALLERVRESYLRQAREGKWITVDASQKKEEVALAVRAALAPPGSLDPWIPGSLDPLIP